MPSRPHGATRRGHGDEQHGRLTMAPGLNTTGIHVQAHLRLAMPRLNLPALSLAKPRLNFPTLSLGLSCPGLRGLPCPGLHGFPSVSLSCLRLSYLPLPALHWICQIPPTRRRTKPCTKPRSPLRRRLPHLPRARPSHPRPRDLPTTRAGISRTPPRPVCRAQRPTAPVGLLPQLLLPQLPTRLRQASSQPRHTPVHPQQAPIPPGHSPVASPPALPKPHPHSPRQRRTQRPRKTQRAPFLVSEDRRPHLVRIRSRRIRRRQPNRLGHRSYPARYDPGQGRTALRAEHRARPAAASALGRQHQIREVPPPPPHVHHCANAPPDRPPLWTTACGQLRATVNSRHPHE